jgi:para-nitrobenzyl esterase
MDATSAPIVTTKSGAVSGRRLLGIEQFIEVPYAAPPVGEARFTAPRPVESWDGVRPADAWRYRTPQNPDTAYGNAPQVFYSIQGDFYAKEMSEDSLTLNIWTPSTTDYKRRPVLVWIHGGGYTVGHAASESYDGENFAREHDMVFVALTHRLNAFGFLYLDDIGGDKYAGSGNAGMLDLVAALEWVRDNIAAFGGDPGNVAIVGESGGGGKVSTLMVMDAAAGLFHRAVCESGFALSAKSTEQAAAYTRALIAQLGGGGISALGDASVDQLLAAQAEIERSDATLGSPGPVIDGVVLYETPLATWESGRGSSVPLLAGWTHDEVTAFRPGDLELGVEAPPAFRHDFGRDRPALFDPADGLGNLNRFAPGRDMRSLVDAQRSITPSASDAEIAVTLTGALLFRSPAFRLAAVRAASGKVTYLYEFDWVSPIIQELGAPHSSDIGLFFANTERLHFTQGIESARSASAAMSGALAAFVRAGDPNLSDRTDWKPYTAEHRAVMVFDTVSSVQIDPDGAVRVALAALAPASIM